MKAWGETGSNQIHSMPTIREGNGENVSKVSLIISILVFNTFSSGFDDLDE